MGRSKKETEEVEEVEKDEFGIENNVSLPPLGIDVLKLVSSAQGRYSKKEAGFKEDLTTGDKITLPNDEDSYIVSPEVAFWRPLTGIPGIPYGRIVQIAGKPDSGKSTTAMLFMKAAQEASTLVILWDAENKFSSKRYADQMGGDPHTLAVVRNKNIVEGAKQVAFFIKAAAEQNPDCRIFVVWDSIGASLSTIEDDDDENYSMQPGQTAKQVGWAIRKFNNLIEKYRNRKNGKYNIAVCCVNQVYATIGAMAKGDKEKGGNELEYLSSIILRLARIKDLSRQRQGVKYKYGIVTKAKVKKNHLFEGKDCIQELQLVVGADGMQLADEVKKKSAEAGITGWDDDSED